MKRIATLLVVVAISVDAIVGQTTVLGIDSSGKIVSQKRDRTALPVNRHAPPDARAYSAFGAEDGGLNTCYLLLRAHGLEIDRDRLRSVLPDSPSLLDLQQAAKRFEVDCLPVRGEFPQLAEQPVPLIASMRSSTSGDEGHFVLVTAFDEKSVDFVDGTTLLSSQMSAEAFSRAYSGAGLVVSNAPAPVSPPANQRLDAVSISLGAAVVMQLLIVVYLAMRTR